MPETTPWWARPWVVGTVLIAFLLFSATLESRRPAASNGRLTTYASDPAGVSGLPQIAEQLGWSVERRLDAVRDSLDAAAIYVILDPPEALTSSETALVLDAVRRGAGLLLAPGAASALADSLRLTRSSRGVAPLLLSTSQPDVVPDNLTMGGASADLDWPYYSLRFSGPPPGDTVVFLRGAATPRRRAGSNGAPIILGLEIGRGRVVVISDPDLLRNQILRQIDVAVVPVRLFEWLGQDRALPLVFAEYHQGYGTHASVPRTVARFMARTPPGRTIAQLLAAGLILLIALGVRPIRPEPVRRIQRRSAMEHVGALSHAYEQVGATRIAAQRLVRGLQRRHPIGMIRAGREEDYLAALVTRHPGTAPAAQALTRALSEPTRSSEAGELGALITRIERTLKP